MNEFGNIHFSDGDVSAILFALPLVARIGADTPAQQSINETLIVSAAEKISACSPRLSAQELRVTACAVMAAHLILKGAAPEYAALLSDEERKELSRYFFNYNRLNPQFQAAMDQAEKTLGLSPL